MLKYGQKVTLKDSLNYVRMSRRLKIPISQSLTQGHGNGIAGLVGSVVVSGLTVTSSICFIAAYQEQNVFYAAPGLFALYEAGKIMKEAVRQAFIGEIKAIPLKDLESRLDTVPQN